MNQEQQNFFKAKLERKAQDLRVRLMGNVASCETECHADFSDFASDEEQLAMATNMIERDKITLKNVLDALDVIADGDYGYCRETGEVIGLQRLLLVPESVYSVESMRVMEAKELHRRPML